MYKDWNTLKADCMKCMKCELGKTRTNLVFGVGNEKAEVMFVGEGPGYNEDMKGEPFVGRGGQLLDKYLEYINLDRHKNIYIANMVKCRPPENRDPSEQEQDCCIEWLREQTRLIRPKTIVCLGRISAISLIDPNFRITREHGKWYEIDVRQVLATFHPSALLRDVSKRPEAFADFREIRSALRALQGSSC